MKNLKVLKLTFLFILTLIMSSTLEAQYFYTPSNGSIIYCPVGQTSTWIYFGWNGFPHMDETWGRTRDGYTGNWYYQFDGMQLYTNGISVMRSFGSQTSWVSLYEEYYHYTPYGGWTTWYQTGFDAVSYTVLPTPTHGNAASAADLNIPGQKHNTQTSNYISPGSIINYTLSISGINYGTTFISASAGINGITGISRETNQPMGTIERSASGTYTMSGGGTLTLYTNVFVGTQGGQAYANASISW